MSSLYALQNDAPVYTLAEGCPVQDPSAATVLRGSKPRGRAPSLLEDTRLIETLAHFPRERIPERVVHAKAAGAWGEFECTEDVSDFTSVNFLNKKGSSDTVRDIRGFALKFFTEEGNWDFVGNDLPVFFIRDPVKFPSLNRSHKRHPQTNVPDSTMFWDFHNNNQEGVHCLMQLFGGHGIPVSLRNVNGFGNHTYKFGKSEDGTFKYVKIHFKPQDGIKNLESDEALRLAGEEPDYHIKDMYNTIELGDYPVWTMYFQVMDPKDAETYRYNIFDITQTWPQRDYPLRPIGKLTLNKNPENHFQDVEQAAFSPSTMVPGIGPSADPMLQARMFSYPDAAHYRVGPNYQQLPCNRALHVYSPYQRDGPMRVDGNYGGDPDYVWSSFRSMRLGPMRLGPPDVAHDEWAGKETGEDKRFAKNVAAHVGKALPEVQKKTVEMFSRVDKEVGEAIQRELDELEKQGGAGIEHDKAPVTG
ncbi:catalase-like domain-containing protein [Sordaria sp. MPI-SDFR-AT-0083]|nr:catalase-like domain-containing protein [Sordaria sp. MPI-SDFR-AT-0083]